MGEKRSKLWDLPQTEEDAIDFFQSCAIIPYVKLCVNGHRMNKYVRGSDKLWRCMLRSCRSKSTIRKGTWFEGSRISFLTALKFIYGWSQEQTSILWCHDQLKMSQCAVVDWNSNMREVCTSKLMARERRKIGGVNCIVEIDESLFSKRKNIAGRVLPQQWIFGGVCRDTNECFVQAIADRSASTLIKAIRDNIHEGSTIYSDCLRGYKTSDLRDAGYDNLRVNHSYNFVDPESGAHTQNIDSLWGLLKCRNKKHRGTAPQHLDSYLTEFIWRRAYKDDPFLAILTHIAEFSPPVCGEDAKKQREMSELSKERDSLVATIKTYRSLFATTTQLITELKASVQRAADEEQTLKLELRKQVPASQLNSVESIENLIKQKTLEKEKLLNAPRRKCTLPSAAHDPDVLGKIGHLAQVLDADVARVLSWHMKNDMDCIVTYTAAKAMELYHSSNGSQQVLALETIFKKTVPEWNKLLPHTKVKNPSWKASGNPIYVRQLLIFPHDPENCKLVFGILLGDTILLDTLEDACAYRQEVVKYTYCPTLLTRQGSCIRSNGKFGGNQNQAPLLEQLRGAVFGEPLSVAYHNLCTLIGTLQNLQQIVIKHAQTKADLREHQDSEKNPQMTEKIRECEEAEDQLREIEKRLGITPTTPYRGRMTTRGAQYVLPPELSKSTSKRSRTSSTTSSVSSVTSSPALNGTTRSLVKRRSNSVSPAADDHKRRRT